MSVTESESAKKWCPHVRALRSDSESNTECVAATNADYNHRNPMYSKCIGSQCMMWVWDSVMINGPQGRIVYVPEDPYADIEPVRPDHVPQSFEWEPSEDGDPAGWVEPEAEYLARRQGHCGLVK